MNTNDQPSCGEFSLAEKVGALTYEARKRSGVTEADARQMVLMVISEFYPGVEESALEYIVNEIVGHRNEILHTLKAKP